MPTTQAHRTRRARRIIQRAYGGQRSSDAARLTCFELLGERTAVARVRPEAGRKIAGIVVAQELTSERTIRLLRENRNDFQSLRELFAYLDELYERYGGPRGEAAALKSERRSGLRLVR